MAATGLLDALTTWRRHHHSHMLADQLGSFPLSADGESAATLARRVQEQATALTSADLYLHGRRGPAAHPAHPLRRDAHLSSARGGLIIENIMTYSTIRPHLPRAGRRAGPAAYTGWAWSGTSPTESTDDAAVVADHTVVAPQVSGFIQEVLAEDNQSVAAGRLLARIDDREYVAALAAARADLAVASAQLVNANATLERHQAVISQALAVTRADAADLRFAESEVQRHRNLASEGAGTRQAYEQARSRLDMTQARQAEHQATLQATRKQQDVLAAQHEAAQAGVLRAQALVDRAELNLSHTRIISPVDGVVGRARVGAVAPARPSWPWCRCSRPTWWRTSAKATDPHATRPARDRHRGCLSRPAAARHRAEHRARHRPEPVAGRAQQRHGQLHQDRAAPAGQDRARRHAGRRAAARGHVGRGRGRDHAPRGGREMSLLKIPRLVLTSALLSLGGCAVGPDFQAPQAQLPTQWRDAGAGGPASAPVAQPVNDAWWDSFGDPELSALVAEASAANPDILIAYERLRQSRAALRVSEADGLPKLGANASYRRGQNSEAGLSDPSGRGGKSSFNLWQTGVDASWELDLGPRAARGRTGRRAVAGRAGSAARRHAVGARETASHYIRLRGAQNQLAVLRQTLDNANRNLALTRLRQREGVATELDVSQADAQAAAIEAAVPLALRVDQLMNALALLLDQPPHALHARLETLAPIPGGPVRVPVGLPSELAERRPDIRQAQARLHAAVAAIGVAEGDFYPRITLSGNIGLQALQLGNLDTDRAGIFGVGPALQIPLFEGGKLRGRLRLREAQAQEAALAFQKTVLGAWHDVDNAMTAYRSQQQARTSLERASASARQALLHAQRRYAEGASDFVNVLSAQNAVLANDQSRVATEAAVSLALVDLYRALGGGWQ